MAQQQLLHGHVPSEVASIAGRWVTWTISKPLEVLIGLPLRNRETLTNLLNDLYNPASPSFHQYLTPAPVHGKIRPDAGGLRGCDRFCQIQRIDCS